MERPSSWPADLPLTSLQELEGTFVDSERWLKELLHWADVLRDPYVRIRTENPSTLSFEFILEDGTKKKESRPVKIVDGWAVVSQSRGVNRDAVIARVSQKFWMRIDSNGALILKLEERTIGAMFFVPAIGKDIRWARIRKVHDQEQSATDE